MAVTDTTSATFRPTFVLDTKLTADEFSQRVRKLINENKNRLDAQFVKGHALVSFKPAERHFWSPWLHVELRTTESGNEIFGRFSPSPSIWTGYMFSYLSLGVSTFFASVFGMAQRIAGQPAWAFWCLPFCALMAIALWIASKAGQNFAREQMLELKEIFTHSLSQA